MTDKFTYTSRTKAAKITTTSHDTIAVTRNHEGNFEPADKDILFISSGFFPGMSFDLDEAKKLYAGIGEVIADAEQIIEDAKPKALDRTELILLPTGARVYVDNAQGYREFIKTENGDFVKTHGDNSMGWVYPATALDSIVFKKEDN